MNYAHLKELLGEGSLYPPLPQLLQKIREEERFGHVPFQYSVILE